MKALLLIEDEDEERRTRAILSSFRVGVLRYRSALKALDNLEELDPDILVISAEDFPRHWKVLAEVVRATKGKSECVIILLGGSRFDLTEADKASHLKINGILAGLADPRERTRFERIIKRYAEVHDPRLAPRVAPAVWDRIAFAFTDPSTQRPVYGRVETVSSTGLSFAPALPFPDFAEGEILIDCTLRVGDRLFDVDCRVIRAGPCLGLAIVAMPAEGRDFLAGYLSRAVERELRARAAG